MYPRGILCTLAQRHVQESSQQYKLQLQKPGTQLCSRGSPLRLGTRRERGRGGANPGGAGRGSAHGGDGEGFPVALSGVATAAGNAHFVRSWVPKDRHPMGAAEGCGPQVYIFV